MGKTTLFDRTLVFQQLLANPRFRLSQRDQYYNTPQNPTILDDKDKVWNKAPRDTLCEFLTIECQL